VGIGLLVALIPNMNDYFGGCDYSKTIYDQVGGYLVTQWYTPNGFSHIIITSTKLLYIEPG